MADKQYAQLSRERRKDPVIDRVLVQARRHFMDGDLAIELRMMPVHDSNGLEHRLMIPADVAFRVANDILSEIQRHMTLKAKSA